MKISFTLPFLAVAIFFAYPAHASTTAPPVLTIKSATGKIKTVPVFDKWTDGGTLVLADLGTDQVPEVIVGAGPGSLPEIQILRQDGSLIKKFTAFDKAIKAGVIVGAEDINNDGNNEILASLGPHTGKYIRVSDGYGKLLNDWYPIPEKFNKIITAANLETTNSSFSIPAPHFLGGVTKQGKEIIVDLVSQRLFAYEDGELAATFLVSTGTKKYPTKSGTFSIIRKAKKMTYRGQGFALPNVWWNSQFNSSEYIHEAYWHNNFGQIMSHGCVNARKDDAKFIYDWAPVGTPLIII